MFLKVLSLLEKTQGSWIALDLKTQDWRLTLQEPVRYVAAGIKHDPRTNHLGITLARISLQATTGLFIAGLSGEHLDSIVLSGKGFWGAIDKKQIQPQDVVQLELYNGFCGACDFDVVCWKATIFTEGNPEKKQTLSYEIR